MITVRAFSLLAIGAVVVAACSGDSPAVPQAGINVTVLPGDNGATKCPVVAEDSSWNIGGSGLAPVEDGSTQSNAPVAVTCTVKAQGSAYQVTGSVELRGKGSFSLVGTFDGTTNEQDNITATFNLPNGLGNWTATDCKATFPKGQMGIAPGRVWATVDCASMTDNNHGTVCEGNAEFRLENCNQ